MSGSGSGAGMAGYSCFAAAENFPENTVKLLIFSHFPSWFEAKKQRDNSDITAGKTAR
jgi:hypothetical protein